MIKRFSLFTLCLAVLAAVAHAEPVIFEPLPKNDSFFGRGAVSFSFNATSVSLSGATLFVISEDALVNGEAWDNYTMTCTAYSNNWSCARTVSFSIAGTDTLEFFYFEAESNGTKGNFGNASSPLRFKIDRTPPNINFIKPVNSSFVSGNVSVQIAATDAVSGVNASTVQFSLNSSGWADMINNISYWNSSAYQNNQTVTLYVRAADNVGNANINAINVTVDNELPSLLVISPLNNQTVKDVVSFAINVSDAYSGIAAGKVRLIFSGADFQMSCQNLSACTYQLDTLAYADKTHGVVFSVHDNASNSNSAALNITLKNNKPSLSIVPGGHIRETVQVNVSIFKPDGIVKNVSLKIGGSTSVIMACDSQFTLCTYSLNTRDFSDGTYTLAASVGNTLNYNLTASSAVVMDNTKPSVTVESKDLAKSTFTVNAQVKDANHNRTNVVLKVVSPVVMSCIAQDDKLYCQQDVNPSDMADGVYDLNVTAYDIAGNSFTASKRLSIDKTPPEVSFLTIRPIHTARETYVIFKAGVTDSVSGVKSVDITVESAASKDKFYLVKAGDVWQNNVSVKSGGAHDVGITVEDFNGNTKHTDKAGYFYIGALSCGDGICRPEENYCLCGTDCAAPVCQSGESVTCGSGIPVCAASLGIGSEVPNSGSQGGGEIIPSDEIIIGKPKKPDSSSVDILNKIFTSDQFVFIPLIAVIIISFIIIRMLGRRNKKADSFLHAGR